MIPQFQTLFGNRGNCMQASVASLLELPLARVPNFLLVPDPIQAMHAFFWRHGFDLQRYPAGWKPAADDFYLVQGLGFHRHEHQCVYRFGFLAHDPNPTGRGLIKEHLVLYPYRSVPT